MKLSSHQIIIGVLLAVYAYYPVIAFFIFPLATTTGTTTATNTALTLSVGSGTTAIAATAAAAGAGVAGLVAAAWLFTRRPSNDGKQHHHGYGYGHHHQQTYHKAPSYHVPVQSYHKAPAPSYHAPAPSYKAPVHHKAPEPTYHAPVHHKAPEPTYHAPVHHKAPEPTYHAPSHHKAQPVVHHAPAHKAPSHHKASPVVHHAPAHKAPASSHTSSYAHLRRSKRELSEEKIDEIFTTIAKMDLNGCGMKLVCNLYQKPEQLLTEREQAIKSLIGDNPKPISPEKTNEGVSPRMLYESAAILGLRQEKCSELYRMCPMKDNEIHDQLKVVQINDNETFFDAIIDS